MKTLFFKVIDDGNKIEDFNEMKALLEKHGIIINWDTNNNWVSIYVDEEKLTRKAGRRSKLTSVNDSSCEFGRRLLHLSDIEKMQEEMKEEDIVSQLNMSRATYYRHLKKAKAEKERNSKYDPIF